jgi:hypothetical protein
MDALSLTQQLFFFMDYINKCLVDPAQHLRKFAVDFLRWFTYKVMTIDEWKKCKKENGRTPCGLREFEQQTAPSRALISFRLFVLNLYTELPVINNELKNLVKKIIVINLKYSYAFRIKVILQPCFIKKKTKKMSSSAQSSQSNQFIQLLVCDLEGD